MSDTTYAFMLGITIVGAIVTNGKWRGSLARWLLGVSGGIFRFLHYGGGGRCGDLGCRGLNGNDWLGGGGCLSSRFLGAVGRNQAVDHPDRVLPVFGGRLDSIKGYVHQGRGQLLVLFEPLQSLLLRDRSLD